MIHGVTLLIVGMTVITVIVATTDSDCYWTPYAPDCDTINCMSEEFISAESRTGVAGSLPCTAGRKKYCCKEGAISVRRIQRQADPGVPPFPSPAGTCYWSGDAPICQGYCQTDEYVAATSRTGDGLECIRGKKKLCCKVPVTLPAFGVNVEFVQGTPLTTTASTTLAPLTTPYPPSTPTSTAKVVYPPHSCHWTGVAPECDSFCNPGEYVAAISRKGPDGQVCVTGLKKYCCRMWRRRVTPGPIMTFIAPSKVAVYHGNDDGQLQTSTSTSSTMSPLPLATPDPLFANSAPSVTDVPTVTSAAETRTTVSSPPVSTSTDAAGETSTTAAAVVSVVLNTDGADVAGTRTALAVVTAASGPLAPSSPTDLLSTAPVTEAGWAATTGDGSATLSVTEAGTTDSAATASHFIPTAVFHTGYVSTNIPLSVNIIALSPLATTTPAVAPALPLESNVSSSELRVSTTAASMENTLYSSPMPSANMPTAPTIQRTSEANVDSDYGTTLSAPTSAGLELVAHPIVAIYSPETDSISEIPTNESATTVDTPRRNTTTNETSKTASNPITKANPITASETNSSSAPPVELAETTTTASTPVAELSGRVSTRALLPYGSTLTNTSNFNSQNGVLTALVARTSAPTAVQPPADRSPQPSSCTVATANGTESGNQSLAPPPMTSNTTTAASTYDNDDKNGSLAAIGAIYSVPLSDANDTATAIPNPPPTAVVVPTESSVVIDSASLANTPTAGSTANAHGINATVDDLATITTTNVPPTKGTLPPIAFDNVNIHSIVGFVSTNATPSLSDAATASPVAIDESNLSFVVSTASSISPTVNRVTTATGNNASRATGFAMETSALVNAVISSTVSPVTMQISASLPPMNSATSLGQSLPPTASLNITTETRLMANTTTIVPTVVHVANNTADDETMMTTKTDGWIGDQTSSSIVGAGEQTTIGKLAYTTASPFTASVLLASGATSQSQSSVATKENSNVSITAASVSQNSEATTENGNVSIAATPQSTIISPLVVTALSHTTSSPFMPTIIDDNSSHPDLASPAKSSTVGSNDKDAALNGAVVEVVTGPPLRTLRLENSSKSTPSTPSTTDVLAEKTTSPSNLFQLLRGSVVGVPVMSTIKDLQATNMSTVAVASSSVGTVRPIQDMGSGVGSARTNSVPSIPSPAFNAVALPKVTEPFEKFTIQDGRLSIQPVVRMPTTTSASSQPE